MNNKGLQKPLIKKNKKKDSLKDAQKCCKQKYLCHEKFGCQLNNEQDL